MADKNKTFIYTQSTKQQKIKQVPSKVQADTSGFQVQSPDPTCSIFFFSLMDLQVDCTKNRQNQIPTSVWLGLENKW